MNHTTKPSIELNSSPAEQLRHLAKRRCEDLHQINLEHLLEGVLRSASPNASYEVLRELLIHRAAALTFEAPEHARLAARFLAEEIEENVASTGATSFLKGVELGHELGLINDRLLTFVQLHSDALQAALAPERDDLFAWFGLKTLSDRYLLRHPTTRAPIETPQHFMMRVAVAVSDTLKDTLDLYDRMSRLELLPSSPTLFNAGTTHEQLSSCFLLDSPKDTLLDIYKRYTDIAMLSKFAGGIGLAYSRVRCEGALIRSTNGKGRGIIPFLKTLDSSVAAVNQGGRRKGACSVYLEPWHGDIEAFLELRDNTGDEARRTHNLNLALWIPDLFMKRVQQNGVWSLFDPSTVPELVDSWGDGFEAIYVQAEKAKQFVKQMPAQELYARMMRTIAETGNGWMCFKDTSNRTCNQVGTSSRMVHLSNLCTEILEVSNEEEIAVCNLASVNLSKHLLPTGVDWNKLAQTVKAAVAQLDRVIDRNLYTLPETKRSNSRWRPVGLGLMGLQDVFFSLRLPFDSPEARALSTKISAFIYYHAVNTSCELAQTLGAHQGWQDTHAAQGKLQPDLWGVEPVANVDDQLTLFSASSPALELDWSGLRQRLKEHGLRNSQIIAIAPTATIASITGCNECVEPQVSNLFKRETLSGEFLQVNRYLVADLRRLGLWNKEVRDSIKAHRGSIQQLSQIPEEVRRLYRTAWELSMRSLIDVAADRGAFIDQSQSLNLFVETPTIGKLSSMYMYAWKRGLKTTYYLRSRPASEIGFATKSTTALACSLENPSSCEACQ